MSSDKNFHKMIWFPRYLTIVFAAFVAMFSLDAILSKTPGHFNAVGFLIHLVPAVILVILLVIGWKRPALGGTAFAILSIAFTVFVRTYRSPKNFILLSMPMFLIAIGFFMANSLSKKMPQTADKLPEETASASEEE